MSGMRTAREIRTTNHELRLVFVTNYEQYAIEGYEVQAFRFLKKPIRYVQFFEIMNKIVADIHKDRSHFAVKNRSGVHHIRTSYVLYAETYRRRTLLHTIEGDVECNQSMSALERELGAQFFRCHAAYLVNLKHVQHIAPTEVVLANQVSLPISKHRRSVFLQAAMNYWGETVL